MNYIHIGYPKNLSTTLQNDFFSKHSELSHLGLGNNGQSMNYLNRDIAIYFESLLRARDIEFKDIHNDFLDSIKSNFKKKYGISHENLSFHFSNDEVDITQKINRLYDLFGKETRIIVIIRNQFDLIKSLYKESLKAGLGIDFHDYVNALYKSRIHSYLQEIKFDRVIELYQNKFGLENILIIPIENFRINGHLKEIDGKNILLTVICNFLEIKYENITLTHNNPSLSDKEAFQLLALNNQYKYNLGKGNYALIDTHKYRDIFEFIEFNETDIYHDVKIKRILLEYAEKLAKNDSRKINYYADTTIVEKLKKMFIESNEKLSKNYGIDLPDNYFKMEF
ncbi:hypothetical protein [Sulfuricurvum sp.]|uniref:hypothetical protein n=1 Tax=Sulfuricurvum sp. TaxID=2025608 RepID=UPI003BB10993